MGVHPEMLLTFLVHSVETQWKYSVETQWKYSVETQCKNTIFDNLEEVDIFLSQT